MHFGKKNPRCNYYMRDVQLNVVNQEKDLGVIFYPKLDFNLHIADAAMRANRKLGMIYRSFKFLNKRGFLKLYKSVVRPTLEYCNVVFSSIYSKEEVLLEKVQERATRFIFSVRSMPYPERLKTLHLPTLAYRRQRAILIQMFKIITGIENICVDKLFELDNESRIRGHPYKLKFKYSRTNWKRNSFTRSAIILWNDLPVKAVCSKTVNSFKAELDTAWADHPLKFSPYSQYDIFHHEGLISNMLSLNSRMPGMA